MSPSVVPNSFLFRYRLPVSLNASLPRKGKRLLNLPASAMVANPAVMDDPHENVELRMAFNEQGLGVQFEVMGKTQKPVCDARKPTTSDGITVWIDTRDTKSIHRASRHCHQFHLLPMSSKTKAAPVAHQSAISNAREDAPLVDDGIVQIQSQVTKAGYQIECWFPAETLNGYSPDDQPLIGFYFQVRDIELGTISPGVSGDFPVTYDPSVWMTLHLENQ